MKKTSNILWGIVLIALGVIFGLKVLGIIDMDIFFDGWWTLFIIVPCIVGLFTDHDKTGSIIGILVGVALLLACQGLFDFGIIWKLIAPVIIVLIGIKLILKGTRHNQSVRLLQEMNESGVPLRQCCAVFSGQNVDYTGEVFDGAELTAVFGGIKCDLRNAVIEKDAVINVCCVFGGVDLFIPSNVNIKVCANSIFGGISDEKHRNSENNTVTLYINGTCLFGGVDIK
ncbi:MAG: LiaF transmembrane domain-containing protein [Hominilimicola sp.]